MPFMNDSDSKGCIDDDTPPSSLRQSKRLKRGVPVTRYDDIYDLLWPETLKESVGGDQTENLATRMYNELESMWTNGVNAFGEEDARVFIAHYVDDFLMMHNHREVLEVVKRRLQERLEKKDLMVILSG